MFKTTFPFALGEIPAGRDQGGWKLVLDGQEVPFTSVMVMNDKYFHIGVGFLPAGYVGPAIWMQNSSVTFPFSWTPEGELLIGLRAEKRLNFDCGQVRWNITGGFGELDEAFESIAHRENLEETGIKAGQLICLGDGVSEDRALFVVDGDNGTNKNFAYPVDYKLLSFDEDTGGYMMTANPTNDKKAESIRFFKWTEAVRKTKDGLALAAVAQLLGLVEELRLAGKKLGG